MGAGGHVSPAPTLSVKVFWDKVDKSGECWLWMGSRYLANRGGHGRAQINGRVCGAHRLSWELTYGQIPNGLWVLHKCGNAPCVRPDHLYLGTVAENNADTKRMGRMWTGDRHWSKLKPELIVRGEKHGRAKLTLEKAREIRASFSSGSSTKELAAKYGISTSLVRSVVRGETWVRPSEYVPSEEVETCSFI